MGNLLSRIQEIAREEGITIGALERAIGASKGVLSRAISNGTDIQSKWIGVLVENYPRYSTRWLLTGSGSMLHESMQPPSNPVSAPSDAMSMRLMDKLDEKDTLLKEKDAENKHLQSELRAMAEELATYKAKYQHPDEAAFAFTPGSSEAYTENSLLTKKPITPSKKLSAGKI